jgi:hypothetical protein
VGCLVCNKCMYVGFLACSKRMYVGSSAVERVHALKIDFLNKVHQQ